MRALNRRVLALEAKAEPTAGDSQEHDDAWCIALAERLEKAAEQRQPGDDDEKAKRELKDLVRRLRAES